MTPIVKCNRCPSRPAAAAAASSSDAPGTKTRRRGAASRATGRRGVQASSSRCIRFNAERIVSCEGQGQAARRGPPPSDAFCTNVWRALRALRALPALRACGGTTCPTPCTSASPPATPPPPRARLDWFATHFPLAVRRAASAVSGTGTCEPKPDYSGRAALRCDARPSQGRARAACRGRGAGCRLPSRAEGQIRRHRQRHKRW